MALRRDAGVPTLRRSLGLRDLVFFYVASIVSLATITQVAQFGLGSLLLYLFAALGFLLPSAVMVAELGERLPEEGGLYQWTRLAFGELHGFICAWCYYIANMSWLPTVSLIISASLLQFAPGLQPALGDSLWYNAGTSLAVLWLLTGLNVLGMERARWVQTAGALGTLGVVAVTLLLGAVYAAGHDVLAGLGPGDLLPDVFNPELAGYFALAAFCFGGLELAPVLAGEIREPRRSIPRAIAIAGVAVFLIYVLLTVVLVLMAPGGEIDIISGFAAVLSDAGALLGLPWLGWLGVLSVVLSTLGLFGAWLAGTARIPFVMGIAHYFPAAFGRVHPRYRSPHTALLAQAVVLSLFMLAASAGATVKDMFLVLLDMSLILYFLPYLYLFAALVWHVRRDTAARGLFPALRRYPVLLYGLAGAGFGTTLLSLLVSIIPTAEIASPALFLFKVVGGAALLLGAGVLVFLLERGGLLPVSPG